MDHRDMVVLLADRMWNVYGGEGGRDILTWCSSCIVDIVQKDWPTAIDSIDEAIRCGLQDVDDVRETLVAEQEEVERKRSRT